MVIANPMPSLLAMQAIRPRGQVSRSRALPDRRVPALHTVCTGNSSESSSGPVEGGIGAAGEGGRSVHRIWHPLSPPLPATGLCSLTLLRSRDYWLHPWAFAPGSALQAGQPGANPAGLPSVVDRTTSLSSAILFISADNVQRCVYGSAGGSAVR